MCKNDLRMTKSTKLENCSKQRTLLLRPSFFTSLTTGVFATENPVKNVQYISHYLAVNFNCCVELFLIRAICTKFGWLKQKILER